MALDQIYKDMTTEQIEILNEVLDNSVKSNIYLQNLNNTNPRRPWMAIFANYLKLQDKIIRLTSTRKYYKQADLDFYYPTGEDSQIIGEPFCRTASQNEYEIQFIDTTTGAKIYEYLTALCKAQPEAYIDRPSLAVSLTEDKSHKLKIVHSNNTVWILSNYFTNEFIEKCLALFPFLFDLKDLQKDENVMNVCKHVAKEEPIKEYFTEIFESIKDIREKQKLEIIKTALNSRVQQQIAKNERDISRIKDNIEAEEHRLTNYYEELENLQINLLGLHSKKEYDESNVKEIIDFINRNRFIQSMTVKSYSYGYSGDKTNMLLLDIIAPISIYEPEPLDKFITARLEDYGSTSLKGKILKAFKRIFVDQELQMICETFVRLDLANIDINANYSTLGYSYYDYKRLCQPHLTRYNCWGDNLNPIKEMLRNGEICDALNNILIATQNINFTDYTVLNSFLDIIANNNNMLTVKSCLSKADGQLWSIKDIIEQIDREEQANQPVEKPELKDTIPEADALDAV